MIIILILNIVAFLFMLGVNFSQGIYVAFLKELNATQLLISFSSSALYITRGTTSILVNKLSKIISLKKLFLIAFIGSSIGSIIIAHQENPVFVASARSIQGAFSGLYWVLINIYAINLGSKFIYKFKNLSSVTIWLNIGGFIGSIGSGYIASSYSPNICFYIGFATLIIGAFVCLFLEDITDENEKEKAIVHSSVLSSKEKTILSFSLFASCVFLYVNIAIPLYILELGGSYKEIGTSTGLSILASSTVMFLAPRIKKKYSYKSIMLANYSLALICIILIFALKSIYAIYLLQSVLFGVTTLERNIWYTIIQEISKNYSRTVGLLRGIIDYLGVVLFIIYGYCIQTFGAINVALFTIFMVLIAILVLIYNKHLQFLNHYKSIHIKSVLHYKQCLHRCEA